MILNEMTPKYTVEEAKFPEKIKWNKDILRKSNQLSRLRKESISETANEYLKLLIGLLEN